MFVLNLASGAGKLKRALGQWLLRSPLHGVYLYAAGHQNPTLQYRRYIKQSLARSLAAKRVGDVQAYVVDQPVISVLMPVHNPNREWLSAAIDSVRRQTHANWELCIYDDGSAATWVAAFLSTQARSDPRIKLHGLREHRGISGALNRARDLASGSHICFLDHDDLLALTAVEAVVQAIQEHCGDVLYTDEDYVNEEGKPLFPHFKPDWSPELLSNCMYLGHLFVVRSTLFDKVGGFRSDFDGAQDYDLALRVAEQTLRIVHIPEVLYHWRRHAGSIALATSSKPYSHVAGRKALGDAARRRELDAEVLDDEISNQYRLRYRAPVGELVSLLTRTPGQGANLLKHTAYSPLELAGPAAADGNKMISGMAGKYIAFVDGDLQPGNPDWLHWLTAQARRPEVGVVGAQIVDPGNRIYDAGVVMHQGHPYYVGRGCSRHTFWKWTCFTRNVSAVGGSAMVVRKDLFCDLGGFDPRLPNLYAIDFCLRARSAGFAVILEKNAVFQRAGSPEGRDLVKDAAELGIFEGKWAGVYNRTDPFYSPHLADDAPELRLVR